MFVGNFLDGALISSAANLKSEKISHAASSLYSNDLIGSAIGALLVSDILIPLLRIMNVCFIIGAANIILASAALFKIKRFYLD